MLRYQKVQRTILRCPMNYRCSTKRSPHKKGTVMRHAHFAPVAAVCLTATLTVAGCQTVSDVTSVGPDTYMVGAQERGGLATTMEIKQLAIKKADAYCAALDKRVRVVSIESSGVQGFTPRNADLVFQCE